MMQSQVRFNRFNRVPEKVPEHRPNAGLASVKHDGSEGQTSHQITPKNCLTRLLKS